MIAQNESIISKKSPSVEFCFLTLFPSLIEPILQTGLFARARKRDCASYRILPLRTFGVGNHKTVDDRPYGGGQGMVLRGDVLYSGWEECRKAQGNGEQKSYTVLLTPQGQLLTQRRAEKLVREHSHFVFVSGHYEGVDERFIEECVNEEISIGDYILAGGELPALVLAEVLLRLVPGVIGNEESLTHESVSDRGLLKYPQYTRPANLMGKSVPKVLLTGCHQAIHDWREAQRALRTKKKRPDLWLQSSRSK